MGAVATHAINPWLFANLPYDPVKDFAPVTIVASVPNVLVMNVEFAQKNKIEKLADLIDYAKKNPGKLNYGSGGNGSAGHLSGELLKARAGISVEHIPYQGAAPAQLALLSGQSDFMFDNLAASAPLIKDGKVKALAVTTAQRSSLLADVPTVEESGIKGFDLGTWFGVFTTGGTPAPVVAKLNQAYSEAMQQPDVKQRLLTMGSEAAPMTPEAFAEFVKSEKAKYQEIVKISGASLN
jgi:tripartite-type tricarboxylate transporter receptor subunit TctC